MSSEHKPTQRVDGNGYSFVAPGGWRVVRAGHTVSASSGDELISVTRFRLAKPYTPKLWPKVVPVLDGVAAQLARGLGGSVESRETAVVAGRRARSYELAFERDGHDFVERIVFLLQGLREYQLLCRFKQGGGGSDGCDALLASFRPA
ncbi:MAG TPA: hypothetical protein VF101_05265 [Gaiellaceae bacterium]